MNTVEATVLLLNRIEAFLRINRIDEIQLATSRDPILFCELLSVRIILAEISHQLTQEPIFSSYYYHPMLDAAPQQS